MAHRLEALQLYKSLLKGTRATFAADQEALTKAHERIRLEFHLAKKLDQPKAIAEKLAFGKSIAEFITKNLVQGRLVGFRTPTSSSPCPCPSSLPNSSPTPLSSMGSNDTTGCCLSKPNRAASCPCHAGSANALDGAQIESCQTSRHPVYSFRIHSWNEMSDTDLSIERAAREKDASCQGSAQSRRLGPCAVKCIDCSCERASEK